MIEAHYRAWTGISPLLSTDHLKLGSLCARLCPDDNCR